MGNCPETGTDLCDGSCVTCCNQQRVRERHAVVLCCTNPVRITTIAARRWNAALASAWLWTYGESVLDCQSPTTNNNVNFVVRAFRRTRWTRWTWAIGSLSYQSTAKDVGAFPV